MKKLISLLAAAVMLVCAAGCGGDVAVNEDSTNTGNGSSAEKGFAKAMAVYPEQAEYPDESAFIGPDGIFDSKSWEEATKPYFDQTQARREALGSYAGELDSYFGAAIRGFLGGAEGENRICSPVNVFAATAMLAELTDGESRQQILDALGIKDMETLRALAATIWNGTYQDDTAVKCVSANSVWLRDDMNYNMDTLQTLAQKYYASGFAGNMTDPAYTRALQDWLNEQTGGLLSEQAGGVSFDPETVCALASTIYFKGKWTQQFNKEETAERVFHAKSGDITCDFMNQTSSDHYFFGEKFGAVGKYFEGSDICMWFMLPDEGVSAEELLSDEEAVRFLIDRDKWSSENQKYLMVDLSVPRFDVNSSMDLVDAFKSLGVSDVFDIDKSDFTPLTEDSDVFVSEIRHAARVKVDEEGCEAAAFTVMMAAGASMPPNERIDFVLDRPFVFAISDGAAQLPLFVGVVNQP